jgi:type I restriction enzyme M protein
MDYWATVMQDDVYLIAADGWKAETYRITETDKKGKVKDKGWACDLVPKDLLVAQRFATEQATIEQLRAAIEQASAQCTELEEEHGGDDGVFAQFDKINKQTVAAGLADLRGVAEGRDDADVLQRWLDCAASEAAAKKKLKDAEEALDEKALAVYPKLSERDVKALVVDGKWLATVAAAVADEVERISQRLTERCRELADRYDVALPDVAERVEGLEGKVKAHLQKMGFAW